MHDISNAQIAAAMGRCTQTLPAWQRLPEWRPLPPFSDIQAGFFDGMSVDGHPTRVFAYLGFPQHATEPVPGVILVHGGGGHAFLPWVRQWMQAGYAALAIDLTGSFPLCKGAGREETDRTCWERPSSAAPYVLPPLMEAVGNSIAPLDRQWIYHAVGNILLANSLLRCCNGVDTTHVGVMGISWGGVATALAIGYDARFAFAIPVYGSGFLEENLTWLDTRFQGEDTLRLWSAADRFKQVTMPVLWQCWNLDPCFSLNTNSLSWQATSANHPHTLLSIVHQMGHSHAHAWQRREPLLFADWIVHGGAGPARFQEEGILSAGTCFRLSFTKGESLVVAARLFTLSTSYSYTENGPSFSWAITACSIDDDQVVGYIPYSAKACYLELESQSTKGNFVTASPLCLLSQIEPIGGNDP